MITDTERLEFITDDDRSLCVRSNPAKTNWVVWDQSDGLVLAGSGSTMREAIDMAIEKVKK